MCNRYEAPPRDAIEREWGASQAIQEPWDGVLFPRGSGPFIRRGRDGVGFAPELVVGQWGLIPWFAKEPKLKYPTNNARSEELADKASYKHPWARGQRCIIPATTFDEPNWETGKNVWWRFARADGRPWGLAGLWSTWTDKGTGEVHESYTMLTINADAHPLMNRMHKPDPKLGPAEQDKRSVIPIEPADYDRWLTGTQQDAVALLQVPAVEIFNAGPAT